MRVKQSKAFIIAVKALVRLSVYTDSPEPSLLENAISTIV